MKELTFRKLAFLFILNVINTLLFVQFMGLASLVFVILLLIILFIAKNNAIEEKEIWNKDYKKRKEVIKNE